VFDNNNDDDKLNNLGTGIGKDVSTVASGNIRIDQIECFIRQTVCEKCQFVKHFSPISVLKKNTFDRMHPINSYSL